MLKLEKNIEKLMHVQF